MAYLLGIDLGTSSLKALIVDEAGREISFGAQKYRFTIPHNGYAEQWPEAWWNACCLACREAMAANRIAPGDIGAIGISGQMHGTVAFDSAMRVIRPAILHCDARTGRQNAYINKKLAAENPAELLMNPVCSGFMLPSLLWLRDNEPQHYEKIRHVALPKDYLRCRMTGELASEYSDASATLLFDLRNGCWSEKILRLFQIPSSILPAVHESAQTAGRLTAPAAEEMGLAAGTPVAYGGGDQVMQAIGNGVIGEPGATLNVGSSAQICFPVARIIENPRGNTNFFQGFDRNHWIEMAATLNGGLCFQWISGILGEKDWDHLNAEIAKIPPGCGGLVFLPYLGGERSPHRNADIRGSFSGLSYGTTRYEMARAVMEGVTFALYDCYRLCLGLGLGAERFVTSGGGARSPQWRQIQADVMGKPLLRTVSEEQASVGAAITAGVCAGIYRDIADGCRAAVRYRDEVTEPDLQNHAVYAQYFTIYRKLFSAQRDVIEELTRLGNGNPEGTACVSGNGA